MTWCPFTGLQRHKKRKLSLRVFVDGLISRMRSTNKRKVMHHEDTLDCSCDGNGNDYASQLTFVSSQRDPTWK